MISRLSPKFDKKASNEIHARKFVESKELDDFLLSETKPKQNEFRSLDGGMQLQTLKEYGSDSVPQKSLFAYKTSKSPG